MDSSKPARSGIMIQPAADGRYRDAHKLSLTYDDHRSLARMKEAKLASKRASKRTPRLRGRQRGRFLAEEEASERERDSQTVSEISKTPRDRRRRNRKRLASEEEKRVSDSLVTPSDTEWSTVVSRRRRRRQPQGQKKTKESAFTQGPFRRLPKNQRLLRVRSPRSAAVAIRIPDGKTSYADIMRKARREIDLDGLEFGDTRIKKDASGGLLVQIPGKDGKEKARQLQSKLQEVLGQEARVTIPSKRAEVRITGFDDSVADSEILDRISEIGGCSRSDIKMGQLRLLTSGLYAVWVQCPVDAIQSLVKAGRIRLGWTSARVVLLPPRRLQCYKCLEFGHVRASCPSSDDRSGLCYRCGEAGHKAAVCSNRVQCPVCTSRGLTADHRVGSDKCSAKRINPLVGRVPTEIKDGRNQQPRNRHGISSASPVEAVDETRGDELTGRGPAAPEETTMDTEACE